ncbi:MAG TPA: hypothetical protein PLJ42_09775 [Chitinophagales bacterium]|jgi:hypothetical protein|nr:hypothetical protein [Chitinophagales bacterium]HQW79710.1 hypothetical protein [Chitinophagales bacterium]HRB18677.1 hypothetical protein [Chitinophagales bacterium]HRB68493.1 hypothetical protein [Chitinophagales bacterium]
MIATDITYNEVDWQNVLAKLENQFGKKPDLQTITFLVGHRELGKNVVKFSKEQKQDLIHVGVCALLSRADYYIFLANDEDGWPHYEYNRNKPKLNAKQQEQILKKTIIEYFNEL